MSVTLYRATVPVFIRSLNVLEHLLQKAEAHAKDQGTSADELVNARLFEDMLPLAGQVQRASDTSKLSAERLSGVEAPKFDDNETTLQQLRERVTKTVSYLKSIDESAFNGADNRTVTLKQRAGEVSFVGPDYLFQFALPNFYFHIVTAYDILRHNGVPIGKLDYLGPLQQD